MTAEPKGRTEPKAGKLVTCKTTATRPFGCIGEDLTPCFTPNLYEALADRVAPESFVCDAFPLLLLLSHNLCLSVSQMGTAAPGG